MKKLIYSLTLLLIAVWLGFLIHQDSGYVILHYNGYTAETSVWIAAACLILFFGLSYALLRFINHTANLKNTCQKWDKRRKADNARDLTNQGLCDLAEGNWQNAQKNLAKAAKHHPNPLINHLAAARAAHAEKNYHTRDAYLREAHLSTQGSEIAVGLTQATLQMESKQWEQALATLNHLNELSPNHPYILKLLCHVHLELFDWALLKKLLPQIKKYTPLEEQELESIDKKIHLGLLSDAAKARDLIKLHAEWDNLPKKWRHDSYVLKRYTDYLIANHDDELAAELISKSLKKEWDVNLLNNYGLTSTAHLKAQIAVAEEWLEKHPAEPELLLCIGRLYFKAKLLGQAEQMLTACVASTSQPNAYIALGQVQEALDKNDQALVTYKKALNSIANI